LGANESEYSDEADRASIGGERIGTIEDQFNNDLKMRDTFHHQTVPDRRSTAMQIQELEIKPADFVLRIMLKVVKRKIE